jgi:hypothetical protein
MNYSKWPIYLHFRFLAHNGHWTNYYPPQLLLQKEIQTLYLRTEGFGGFAFTRGGSSFVVRLKNNKLWRSRCLGESLGKESFFVSTILQLAVLVVVVVVVLARTHARTDAHTLVFSFFLMFRFPTRFIALAVLAVFVVLLLWDSQLS